MCCNNANEVSEAYRRVADCLYCCNATAASALLALPWAANDEKGMSKFMDIWIFVKK